MKHGNITYTLDLGVLGEQDCEVCYIHYYGQAEVQHLPNGYPAEPDFVEIEYIWLANLDILYFLSDNTLSDIKQVILEMQDE